VTCRLHEAGYLGSVLSQSLGPRTSATGDRASHKTSLQDTQIACREKAQPNPTSTVYYRMRGRSQVLVHHVGAPGALHSLEHCCMKMLQNIQQGHSNRLIGGLASCTRAFMANGAHKTHRWRQNLEISVSLKMQDSGQVAPPGCCKLTCLLIFSPRKPTKLRLPPGVASLKTQEPTGAGAITAAN
jgi:hypothetical protein